MKEHLPLASSLCPNDFPMTLEITPRKANLIGGETLESGLGRHWEKGQKSKCEVATSTYNKITTLPVQTALYSVEIQVISRASSGYVFLSSIGVKNMFNSSKLSRETRLMFLKYRQQRHLISANNQEKIICVCIYIYRFYRHRHSVRTISQ